LSNSFNIVSGSSDRTIRIWQSEYPFNLIKTLNYFFPFNALAILPNSNNIVSGSSQGNGMSTSINIWNSKSFELIHSLKESRTVYSLTILYNSNNNIVSSGGGGSDINSDDGNPIINIWQSDFPYNLITTLYGHSDSIRSLVIKFNSNNIISGSYDSTIKIWSQIKFEYYSNLTGHTDAINDLVFFNNGDLVSCSKDKSIRVWNMNTFQTKFIKNLNRSCLSLTLLNNYNLVSTSEDKSIKIWDTNLFYNISIIH
jgi:WD40 repeat protein